MPKIPFTVRRDGRYYFRRRARWQNRNDLTVIIPLSTCSAQEARGRAAALAAHFDRVKRAVSAYFQLNKRLEPGMLKALFDTELKSCLIDLVEEFHDPANDPQALIERFRTHAGAYDLAQRPGVISELSADHRQKLLAAGLDEGSIEWVACDLDRYCGKDTIDDETMALIAEGLDIDPTPAVIGRMKHIHLQARAEAHRLASLYMDDDVQSSIDQEEALLAKRRPNGVPMSFIPSTNPSPTYAPPSQEQIATDASVAGSIPCPFISHHETKFSEAIPTIMMKAQRAGHWTRNLPQYKRVLKTFAWITGDKALGDYNHTDVAKYKNALLQMPRNYKPSKDFDRPFDEVIKTIVLGTNPRSPNTIKRDFSYLSTACEILSEDEWAPKIPNSRVLDFSKIRFGKKHKKVSAKTARPPWTVDHMRTMFSAPIWTGGGGHLSRLKEGKEQVVYHDAAYWLPLLLYYTHATVNEVAGLRADEVEIGSSVPFITIKDNDVRGQDGVDGGEKNESRGRLVPLHNEILRLGFAKYVSAIRAEGHHELFPELFKNKAKVGGDQFRNIAWRFMVMWLEIRMPIPRNPTSGKCADMHSIRSLASSNYAQANAPDFMRADVMGHARTGTNALHYSKRMETHGMDRVLGEYRAFMTQYTEVVSDHILPYPLNSLPLNHRSRTGKP